MQLQGLMNTDLSWNKQVHEVEWTNLPYFNPLLSGNPKMGTQANSADPDQTLHNEASDQGLHCLLTAIFV